VLFNEMNEEMPKIVIQNLFNRTVHSEIDERKVIELILENGIDWMHACGKKGRCTTCKIIVVEGEKNLSEMNEVEVDFAKKGRLSHGERLACQSVLLSGEIKVKVAQSNKFPHVQYSD
jgi:ferredoxin, 2Fe-2S